MVGKIEQELYCVEKSTNKELGKQIRNEIENLANKFMELDDAEERILRSKKSIILEIADKFETLKEIGEYELPIHTIASSVLRYLQIKGYSVTKIHVYNVIRDNAPQYISISAEGNSYQDVNSLQLDINLERSKITDAVQTLKNANWKILKRDQVQDSHDSIFEIVDTLDDFVRENEISTTRGDEGIPHYDSQELDPFKDPVITDKSSQEPRESNLSSATFELADAIDHLAKIVRANAKMMMSYPPDPEDQELEMKGAQRIREWASWFRDVLAVCFKSGTDRKYRRSIFEWVKIADDENDWGKHAASSKNPYLAKFQDPKTGEWKQEIRKLTREQIGDKSPKVREFTRTFAKLIPAGIDIIRWSEKNLNPFTNGESIKLGPKLSDRSLR
jgi:hypothetical protein